MKAIETKRDEDENKWLHETAEFVQSLNLPELAESGLWEYLTEMSKADERALKSQIRRLIWHLLKFRYQPQKQTVSWATTVDDARVQIADIISDSPSLKPKLKAFLVDKKLYDIAKKGAETETKIKMPAVNPFTIEEILDNEFYG